MPVIQLRNVKAVDATVSNYPWYFLLDAFRDPAEGFWLTKRGVTCDEAVNHSVKQLASLYPEVPRRVEDLTEEFRNLVSWASITSVADNAERCARGLGSSVAVLASLRLFVCNRRFVVTETGKKVFTICRKAVRHAAVHSLFRQESNGALLTLKQLVEESRLPAVSVGMGGFLGTSIVCRSV